MWIMGNILCWKKTVDGDSAWRQQNKEQGENIVYKYINLQKGGKLIDVYMDEGPEAADAMIQEELLPLMYDGGKGATITKLDYIKWKNQCHSKMVGTTLIDTRPDEQILADFVEDKFNKFEEHMACWDLNQRGAMGETCFHLCVLHDSPIHADIARMFLKHYPKVALDFYEADEYFGESALHLAIVYGDFEMVRLLVENGANVNLRASGRFFLPEDQKKGKTKFSNYEGYAYYGEYPLAFAACFGHEEIYDYLIDHGADPNLKDSFGNTVLHMLVISNQIGMFAYAVKHHAKKAQMEATNDCSLTPLTLASKLGRNEIFKEIIELQSIEIWRYSNITCATYPLAPLDTIGPLGRTNWSSALIYITNGETEEHLEMLGGGVIKQLLDEKWKTFARRRFVERLILAILHLAILSIAIYLRPDSDGEGHLLGPTDTKSIVRYISEIIVCCDCLVTLIFQLEEIRSQGILGVLKNLSSAPAKGIFNISCVLILLCIPFRLLHQRTPEVMLLAFAAPCAWAFLLFFARGLSLWGPFIVMIFKMCTSDLVRFNLIFIVFIVQFSQAFYFLFRHIEETNINTFATPGDTFMQMFQMTLGEFKYNDFNHTRHPVLTKAVFAVFAILVPILLLNMLIAMMGNTYQQIISRSAKEWRRQWAKIVIVLERTFSRQQLLKYQEEYSVKLLGRDNDRGLMVIKTSAKTKARQRKGAISNWKKLVKEIKDLIKDQKKKGRAGPIDLTSQEVAQHQQRKRQSKMDRQLLGAGNDDLSASTDGLLSAMTQLAWEKDIDLMKAPKKEIREEEIAELEQSILKEEARSQSVKNVPRPLSSKLGKASLSQSSSPLKSDSTKHEQVGMKDLGGGLRSNKVAPQEKVSSKSPTSADSGSPVPGDNQPQKPNASNVPKKKKPLLPKSAKQRSGSGESKDSAFSEGKPKPLKAMDSRTSSNSASSLTSLLNAWDDKPQNSDV